MGNRDNIRRNKKKNSNCKTCVRKANKNRNEILPDDHPTIVNGKRICASCKEFKGLVNFGVTAEGKLGRNYRCKTCKVNTSSVRQSVYLYGITFDQKVKMLKDQNGMCANTTCSKKIFLGVKSRSDMAVVDHNHCTGEVRQLLCSRCNIALGTVENYELVSGLQLYLKKHSGE